MDVGDLQVFMLQRFFHGGRMLGANQRDGVSKVRINVTSGIPGPLSNKAGKDVKR
jgi:hypothetical protein